MSKITWFNKPKIINYIPTNKYVLFIDESGTNSKKVFEIALIEIIFETSTEIENNKKLSL